MTEEEAATRLPWVDARLDSGMPAHQYVVVGEQSTGPREGIDQAAVNVLRQSIQTHPDGYDAYFRGYQRPTHYLELSDGLRYWRTSLYGTEMLNRCHPDSVEPPRRVDQGARPIPWQGNPWDLAGSVSNLPAEHTG